MKRAKLLILVVLILGISTPMSVFAGVASDYEVVKGQLIDSNGDGVWDGISFIVKTKSTKLDFPVLSVNLINTQSSDVIDLSFSSVEINKKVDEYCVDLPEDGLSEDFSIEINLDISALSPDGDDDVGSGGPGATPKETILIIDYP